MASDESERVLERLIAALAAQVASAPDGLLADEARVSLADLGRGEVRWLFAVAGHLVHYGDAAAGPLEALAQQVTELQREETTASADTRARGLRVDLDGTQLLPGDEVRVSGDVPQELHYGVDFLCEAVFVVRWVGADGTVDIQPGWDDDYVIVTVPLGVLQRAG